MVHFALYRNLSSRFLSFPPALPLISPPSLGLKTGGVFPFCQSQLCLIGLSLYQCKQKRGNSVGCFLLSKKTSFWCLFDPGRWNSNCYHLWNKMTSGVNSLAMQIQKRREARVVWIGRSMKRSWCSELGLWRSWAGSGDAFDWFWKGNKREIFSSLYIYSFKVVIHRTHASLSSTLFKVEP